MMQHEKKEKKEKKKGKVSHASERLKFVVLGNKSIKTIKSNICKLTPFGRSSFNLSTK
jgi:uncharacterized protein YlbG (UPF0298 family)